MGLPYNRSARFPYEGNVIELTEESPFAYRLKKQGDIAPREDLMNARE